MPNDCPQALPTIYLSLDVMLLLFDACPPETWKNPIKGNRPQRAKKWKQFSADLSYLMEVCGMRKAKTNVQGNASTIRWVNVRLSEDDCALLERAEVDSGKIVLFIADVLARGYSFSVKTSPDGAGFMATIVGQTADCRNIGLGLSGFSNEPETAVLSLMYKYYSKLPEEWPNEEPQAKSRFR
jgi:hypothetical protein